MISRDTFLSVLVILCTFSASLSAQGENAPVRVQACSMIQITQDNTLWWANGALPPEEQRREELDISHVNLGKPVTIRGARKLIFFRGKQDPKPFAKASIPANLRSALLVFVGDVAKPLKGEAEVLVTAGKDQKFGPGDYRFLNFSSRRVGVKYGNRSLVVGKGSVEVLKGNRRAEEVVNMQIFYEIRENGRRRSKKIMDAPVKGQDRTQVLFFLWDDNDGKRMRFRPMSMLPIEPAAER